MKKLLILLFTLFLLAGCGNKDQQIAEQNAQEGEGTVQKITCAKMKTMLQNENDIVLIDVRTPAEYEEQHLSKAINIPNESIKDIKDHEEITKDTIIIVYCRSGARSSNSASELIKMGYKNVYNLGAMSECSK